MFIETTFIQFPDYATLQNFVNRNGTAYLYGYTFNKFTQNISTDCGFSKSYEFIPDDLYEFSYKDGIYSLKNLSEEARASVEADNEI